MVKISIPEKEIKVFEKPLIEEGVYIGRCKEIKENTDAEGNPRIDVWNNQVERRALIWVFEVFDKKTREPIQIKEKTVEMVQYTPYLARKVGESEWNDLFRAEKNKTYQMLKAMGVVLETKAQTVDFDDYVGKEVKLTIADYEKKNQDGTTQFMSIIESVKPLTPPASTEPKSDIVKTSADTSVEQIDMSEDNDKLAQLKKQLDDGMITQRGYDMAVAKINGTQKLDIDDDVI